ncbi:MAG: hypothetical protein H6706_28430 [Myxococcales bacterium]|nr:hypothetical protein [Myxococcales bacterium]
MSTRHRPPSPTEIAIGQAQDRALALPDRDHAPRLAPRVRFEAWRGELERARSGNELLDAFIDPADAPRLVPMLPVEDLHRALHRIGLEDATDVLAMASGEQVQGLLDAEIWVGDELSIERTDPWLRALMAAGPDVLGKRLIDLDDELLNWIIRRSIQTIVVEEPEDFDPPDVEHVMTPDGRLCICFPDPGERDLPIKVFLDWLMRTAPVYCIDLLIGASAALDSSLQEDALRWRTGRLADRGYVDLYDALAIYAPPPPEAKTAAAATDDAPGARHWLTSVVQPEHRLAEALGTLDADAADRLVAQLGYAANMALSADRREPWDLEGQAETLHRLRAGLVLGLDAFGGTDARTDALALLTHGPAVVFRTGYARMVAAAAPLRRRELRPLLRQGDDAVGALDVPLWHAWGAALTARHPQTPDGGPIGPGQWARASAWGRMLAALTQVAARHDRPVEVGVGAWLATGLARAALDRTGFGPLEIPAFPAALEALFGDRRLRPEARALAARWWAEVGDGQEETLACLLVAFTEQAAALDAAQVDPRQVPLLLPAL